MLRQRKYLSAFKQHQEHNSFSDEEYVISDFSENEENRTTCDITSKTLDADNTVLSVCNKRTQTRRNSSCTPSAKRIKRIPLSMVCHRRLRFDLTERLNKSAYALNGSVNFSAENSIENDENELPEPKIEWSSSEESEIVTSYTSINDKTQSTQETHIALIECSPSPAQMNRNPFKRCRKGGYLQKLQQTLSKIYYDRKFLEHDKKLGIRQMVSLRVLCVENSFGVHSATVVSPCNEVHQIVLDANMAKSVRIGSTLECLTEEMEPYEVECCDGTRKVYVEPSKFTLC